MRIPDPVFVALLALVATCCGRARHDPAGDRPARGECEGAVDRPPGLVVAGSGPLLAPVREIARRYEERFPGTRVSVPESIGTGGAVDALLDGAIDVGLASRPLREAERARGLVETPLATGILAFVVHPPAPVRSLARADLLEIYAGRRTSWPDGTPIVPLMRESGDSGAVLLASAFPELGDTFEAARASERLTVCYTDQETRDALLAVEGSIGFLDLGTIRLEGLDLVPIALDGVEPSPERVRDGRYRFVRELAFLTVGTPAGDAAAFIEFARSSSAADVLDRGGFLPASGDGR